MVPSNGLADELAMVTSPMDLDFENGTIDLTKQTFTPTDGSAEPIALIGLSAPDGGQELTVLVANRLTLDNVVIIATSQSRPNIAFAAVAASDIVVSGTNYVQLVGYTGDEQCQGAGFGGGSDGSATITTGGGGGGYATIGGDGAGAGYPGGIGGAVSGNETLIPLRGGCDGGHASGRSELSLGGGAIQLTSLTSVSVEGIIAADGTAPFSKSGAGGASGGAILLEAPVVTLGASGALLARGAGGAAGDGTTGPSQLDALSQPGGACKGGTDQETCSAGGAGASPNEAAQNGEDFNGDVGSANISTGGGGGGLGRIRINTADGTFTPGSGALVAGSLTVGPVMTQ
jgi:hypothetical protein